MDEFTYEVRQIASQVEVFYEEVLASSHSFESVPCLYSEKRSPVCRNGLSIP